MPKKVDHEARRRKIAEAVWRIASRAGLESVTLRQVAAEARMSTRLVQYYFGTRDDLLRISLQILNNSAEEEAAQRIGKQHDQTPSALLKGVLSELLPADEKRRVRQLVHVAYFVRAVSDETLAASFRSTPPVLERLVADLIAAGKGHRSAGALEALEAEALLGLADGLATRMLLGTYDYGRALELIDWQISQILKV